MSKGENEAPDRPDPTAAEKAAIEFACARGKERRAAVTVHAATQLPARKDGQPRVQVRPGHADIAGWCEQLKDTFGTASTSFATVELDRLISTMNLNSDAEGKINAAMAAMTAAEPQDEMEAQLASQMVANHGVIMEMLSRVKHARTVEHLEAYGRLANRLLRAYALQTEAYAKLRRGGQQVVRVEHVHIHAGGRAIVGTVEQGRGNGKIGQQPQALEYAPGATLPSENETRDALPAAGNTERTLPHARRRIWQRSTKRPCEWPLPPRASDAGSDC